MEHIILKTMLLHNCLHVLQIHAIAYQQKFQLVLLGLLARPRTHLLCYIRHHSLYHNSQRDEERVDEAVMREMLLEENGHCLVERIHIPE